MKALGKLTFSKRLIVGFLLMTLGGFFDGAVEGFDFDGRVFFEKHFDAYKYGFFGSQSWRMVYVDGNPELGFKSALHKWAGALDFYHVADDLRKSLYIIGGVLAGAEALGLSLIGRVLFILSALAISGLSKSLAMGLIR